MKEIRACWRRFVDEVKKTCKIMESENGMGVVEVILIIVVLVMIALIFKKQIIKLVNDIWNAINKDAKAVYK